MATISDCDTTLRVVVVENDSQLRRLVHRWNELAGGVPFRRLEWVESWWRDYRDPHSRLFTLAVVNQDGETVGIAPWYLSHSRKSARRAVPRLGRGLLRLPLDPGGARSSR